MSGLRRLVALLLLGAVVTACSGDDGNPPPTASSAADGATTTAPATTPTTAPTTSSPLRPVEGCPDPGPLASPAASRPVYRADVTVDVEQSVVYGAVTVRFSPDLPVSELVFRLWPNSPVPAASGVLLTVPEVRLGGSLLAVQQPDPTTLAAALPSTIDPGEAVEVTLPFELRVPGGNDDRLARHGDAFRLGSFLPILAWQPGIGWATEPATAVHGEAVTSPAADYDVGFRVPPGVEVLASGQADPATGRWSVTGARDFAATVGRFRRAEAVSAHGVHVVVGVDQGVADDPQDYVDQIVPALESYTARFGSYPWPSYTVGVTGGFGGGIEFPSHVMQASGSLGRSVVHEVAHQWFYALVGNNQAVHPWLDEGVTSYAEFIHLGTVGRQSARPVPSDAQGRGGEPMTYWEGHAGSYYVGVYVQPGVALAGLGSSDDVDCALRHYVARHAYAIATPGDLLAALDAVFPDATAALAPYGLGP